MCFRPLPLLVALLPLKCWCLGFFGGWEATQVGFDSCVFESLIFSGVGRPLPLPLSFARCRLCVGVLLFRCGPPSPFLCLFLVSYCLLLCVCVLLLFLRGVGFGGGGNSHHHRPVTHTKPKT